MIVRNFRDVIALWGPPSVMANDVGVKVARVRKWRQRNKIPDEWWERVALVGQARGFPITAAVLANIAARSSERAAA